MEGRNSHIWSFRLPTAALKLYWDPLTWIDFELVQALHLFKSIIFSPCAFYHIVDYIIAQLLFWQYKVVVINMQFRHWQQHMDRRDFLPTWCGVGHFFPAKAQGIRLGGADSHCIFLTLRARGCGAEKAKKIPCHWAWECGFLRQGHSPTLIKSKSLQKWGTLLHVFSNSTITRWT